MTAPTYYDRPVVKEPVWEPTIGVYFFTGGLAGASAGLGLLARLCGRDGLARACTLTAAGAAAVSPVLLISDLGRPERFANMLRVFKVTSPMSVGTWILSGFGSAIGIAAASEVTGIARPVGRVAEAGAAALGLPLATYTSALLSTTSMRVWHRARNWLPFLFAAGSAASAGAAATLLAPPEESDMAARLAIGGALAEVIVARAMERSLGEDAAPYESGEASRWSNTAIPLLLGGAAAMLAGRWWRPARLAGATAVLAGSLLERLAVWKAGTDSARTTKT